MLRRGIKSGILCLALAGTTASFAADGAGTESPLSRPTDARVLAMGGVATALGDGPESAAQNPARLAWLEHGVFSLYHTDLYTPDTALQSGFVAYPTLELGTMALGVQRLGVGGIDARDERNVDLGAIDVSETHVALGYAYPLRRWLAFGASLRIVQLNVASTRATGAGLDVGLSTSHPIGTNGQFVDTGLSLQNLIAPSLRLDEDDVDDPLRTRLGLAYRWDPTDRRLHAALAVEGAHASTADARWGLGAEIGFDHLLFLRGGVDTGDLTAGLGVRMRGVEFAYAFRTDEDLPRDDRFTIALRFGSSIPERRDARIRGEEARIAGRLASMLAAREDEALRRARDEASAAWNADDFERAEVLYGRVLLLDPDDAEARTRIDESRRRSALRSAYADLEAGAAARAATRFQRILDHWIGDPDAVAGLATARESIERDRDHRGQIRALFSDALDRFTDDDLLGARAALDELLRLDATHEGATELLGRVETTRQGRVDAALAASQRDADAGRYERAISTLERVRVLAPSRDAEFATLIDAWRIALERRRDESARESAARAAASRADARSREPIRQQTDADRAELRKWFAEGLQEFEDGEYERATLSWRRVWEVDPQHGDVADHLVRAHLLLGIEAYTRGEYDRALDQCRRALDVDPQNEKARRYVARIEEERSSVRAIDRWKADR